MISDEKYLKLINYLKDLKKVLVAFSGGVDSTFLLKAAKDALKDKVKAVIIVSPYMAKWEIKDARELADELNVDCEIIRIPIIDTIKRNPKNRCYLCKKFIFSKIREIAKNQGYDYIVDGTNFDDTNDYRPGIKALKELNIKSPLFEVNLTKEDVRILSKKLGLKTWNKPSYACLLTRLPYGEEFKIEDFEKIEKAEKYMMDIGFKAVRVRCHKNLARIEVNREDRKKLFDEKLLDKIVKELKEYGFQYITLDMEGYRVGSFNQMISSE
ncbi:ATP-dependent sacrificial sulfur transferase LarE [Caminicella sporogenes]|uniref:ATP-dependent sacrificial sulfur transferase LarE n=1 Tax=Caminicella sporogenes TaxID=166485 RepID=UPI0025407EC5|nr:ATP-dependent sacrificial sulfur transferase LarE [Caminicella sporogenes]WIF95772.1 ATP-dependent sacrificial sulfur transferase LarE [Caminicella sporogenes]